MENNSPPDSLLAAIHWALAFDFQAITPARVAKALQRESLTLADLGALLSPVAADYLEPLAQRARRVTRSFFGRNIGLYTPLYLANHCVNHCLYCGYHYGNAIRRGVLTPPEIAGELAAIKAMGLSDVLLLTGESRQLSGPDYLEVAVRLAARNFASVGLEVYPLKTEEYARLRLAGADYVCVYQETYDPQVYAQAHPKGPKRNYAWRLGAPGRALAAGIRGVGLGALLGLADFRHDALALGAHGQFLERQYPAADLAYSTPRLRPIPGVMGQFGRINERELTQIILALRLFSPSFGLSLSTRESPGFRDNLIGLGITRLSAAVKTSVGGHDGPGQGDEQFQKSDGRDVAEVCQAIVARGHQPVFTDYARL
ncbi:MAG: 2-iminoacetate synthase ThiH [Deltaproteobacteria bacterium]|jgi:2-iminoacetate synthase|nr:2-iminoacetate synthase ThiH [Deltaproteobacteria bacterium]